MSLQLRPILLSGWGGPPAPEWGQPGPLRVPWFLPGSLASPADTHCSPKLGSVTGDLGPDPLYTQLGRADEAARDGLEPREQTLEHAKLSQSCKFLVNFLLIKARGRVAWAKPN